MPFTPFHLALPLLLYSILQFTEIRWDKITWISIFIGSILPDLQGFYAIFFDHTVPLHGFSHTFIGSIVYSGIYVIVIGLLKKYGDDIKFSFKMQFITIECSILFFHILPDALIYPDLNFLWPIANVSIVAYSYNTVTNVLIVLFLISIALLIIKYIIFNVKSNIQKA